MKKDKILVIVDMQNDFITGSLANSMAQLIVKPICSYIKKYKKTIKGVVFTRDTHDYNYLKTFEGRHLPIPHCIEGTPGWCINSEIFDTVRQAGIKYSILNKSTFEAKFLRNNLDSIEGAYTDLISEIVFVGTCTDICVVSNALALRPYTNAEISVIADLCAGTTLENHKAALAVMKSCQINIK